MLVSVPKEVYAGERRVALTPETASHLIKLGHDLVIESGAGEAANFSDQMYLDAGVEVTADKHRVWSKADVLIKVRAPALPTEVDLLSEGSILISFIWPAQNDALLAALTKRKVTVLAMDSVPRISRAPVSYTHLTLPTICSV